MKMPNRLLIIAVVSLLFCISVGNNLLEVIPKTWDLKEIKRFHLPPPDSKIKVVYAPEAYYNSLPEHVIYKTYPVYVREHEPDGYLDSLRTLEPEVAFDLSKIKTQEDWIKAGEAVFHWPAAFSRPYLDSISFIDQQELSITGSRSTKEGIYPYSSYIVKNKGEVIAGALSCANCHSRVMDDGTLVEGAQGDNAFDAEFAFAVEQFGIPYQVAQEGTLALVNVPWAPEIGDNLMQMDSLTFLNELRTHVPGVMARQGISFSKRGTAVSVPSLIGIKDIKYFDKTGLMKHEGAGDLMRYAAFNQGMDMLTSYDNYIPLGTNNHAELPKLEDWNHPFGYDAFRYTDAQLYALAQYIYSLEAPENPNQFEEDVLARGEHIFKEQGCVTCHTPPLYTNNMLTPALGFEPPEDHFEKYDIFNVSVETDPTLALKSRRGTGYYKIPSLLGLWYRGFYLHDGHLGKLEDLFDPARLEDDYVPTGYKPYGVESMSIPGHEFGMDLSEEDKTALVSFLKSL